MYIYYTCFRRRFGINKHLMSFFPSFPLSSPGALKTLNHTGPRRHLDHLEYLACSPSRYPRQTHQKRELNLRSLLLPIRRQSYTKCPPCWNSNPFRLDDEGGLAKASPRTCNGTVENIFP